MAEAATKTRSYQTRMVDCVNCHKPIALHWFLRHTDKCLEGVSSHAEIRSQAVRVYNEFLATSTRIPIKSPVREILEAQEQTASAVEAPDQETEMAAEYELRKERIKQKLEEKKAETAAKKEQANAIINDQQLTEPKPEDKQMLNDFHKVPGVPPAEKPVYKEIVDCVVDRIEQFGVIVHLTGKWDGWRGLIHKKSVKKDAYNGVELERYFRPGDRLKASVVDMDRRKMQFRQIGLSTRDMELPDYYQETPAPAAVKQEQIVMNPLADKLALVKDQIQVEEKPMNTAVAHTPPPTAAGCAEDSQDVKDVIAFVHKKVGAVSPAAYVVLKEMVEKHGMFKFMVGLMSAASDFQPDLGLIFAREIETKLRDSL